MQMGQVIGPINAVDWLTLKMLKESIEYSRRNSDEIALKKERNLFKEVLSSAGKAA